MSDPYHHAGSVRHLQDEQAARPAETPGYAIATLVMTTSLDNLIEHQLKLKDAWTADRYHKPRNKQPTRIEDTKAYVKYAQQMAYQGKEIWK